jgi:hypothetical protein
MKEAFAVCVRQKSRIIIYEGSMLPRGYKSLVICDTHRAEEWKAGLARAGFDVALAETAPDNVKGACEVGWSRNRIWRRRRS